MFVRASLASLTLLASVSLVSAADLRAARPQDNRPAATFDNIRECGLSSPLRVRCDTGVRQSVTPTRSVAPAAPAPVPTPAPTPDPEPKPGHHGHHHGDKGHHGDQGHGSDGKDHSGDHSGPGTGPGGHHEGNGADGCGRNDGKSGNRDDGRSEGRQDSGIRGVPGRSEGRDGPSRGMSAAASGGPSAGSSRHR